MLILTGPDEKPITRWEDWTRPKRDYQWAEGRSAMELAKAWFRNGAVAPPEEFLNLLLSRERFSSLRLIHGKPEFVTQLPMRGEGRNHDLWLQGTAGGEDKADEPFGNHTIEEYRSAADSRATTGRPSGVPERIGRLLQMVPAGKWDNVMYQLLNAICGTAIQARIDHSSVGAFVVHEFHTSKTKEDNIRRNRASFEKLLRALGLSAKGHLLGPVSVAGIECFVGRTAAC